MKEQKGQACKLLGPWSYLAAAINEAPLWLSCSLQEHLHDPFVCQQPQEHRPKHPWCYQGPALRYKFIIQKDPTPEDGIPGLWSATEKHHVQDRTDFLSFCPFTARYPMEPHTCMRTPLGEPSISHKQMYCYSHSSGFPTSPFAKHLFLAITAC